MHLADGEIVEVEAQFRCHIGVRRLLVRQDDIEADGRATRIGRTTIARFHDARTAAGDHDIFEVIRFCGIGGAKTGKLARLIVIDGGLFQIALLRLVARRPGFAAGFGNARAAEHDDGGFYAALGECHFRLQKLKLQPDGAQFLAAEKIHVHIGEAIGRGVRLRCFLNDLGLLLVHSTALQRVPYPVLAPQLAVFQSCHFHAFRLTRQITQITLTPFQHSLRSNDQSLPAARYHP
ncbi:hypothetical protein D3C72_784250 [compost metagenome]